MAALENGRGSLWRIACQAREDDLPEQGSITCEVPALHVKHSMGRDVFGVRIVTFQFY